ncbi:ABC-2 transporter permease [Paenibacillus polysaccharolyticus]|uniref:ABC-2 transporter permease n=1 Tax=Paenibacillus polysaccharolyticus TaxID=582692 RepID=UPI00203AC31A|nr:ABC-2 transporter permease [Paenibacillus polysaccharolyticus]MCM3133512.1 ABC-2 transporter permease [Paenibacillus polysaccharolyticus]
MKGLLMTSYYLVYRSSFWYTGLAILLSVIILTYADASMHRLVAMLNILLMVMTALDVIKFEGKSGYDKYVLTLPVSRGRIVQSHYLFYFLVVIYGVLLSFGIFYIYSLVSGTEINNMFHAVFFGTFAVLITGGINFPLYYIFGSEKSDSITLGSVGGAILITIVTQSFVGGLATSIDANNPDPFVPIIYLLFGLIVYIISLLFSILIYQKKEF